MQASEARRGGAIHAAFATTEANKPTKRYVATDDIKRAVDGHETRVLAALNIDWTGKVQHITCPFPGHGGKLDWRWSSKDKKAFCTCGAWSIFDCVMECRGIDFDEAKIFVADAIGRSDLIKSTKAKSQEDRPKAKVIQLTSASALLAPTPDNRDDGLVRCYLADRLTMAAADVVMPATAVAGIKSLAYFELVEGKDKPVTVGEWPCAVFQMVDREGRQHAQRIYLAPGGAGKADLGLNAAGEPRDAKKSAKVAKDDGSIAGRAVLFGKIETALSVLLCEGIETGAAIAYAFRDELHDGSFAVAAGVTAGGLEAFTPWEKNVSVIVCADRDERPKAEGKAPSRRGEVAARKFGRLWHDKVIVSIAMPGDPDTSVDWLDVLLAQGAEAIRAAILNAEPFILTDEERGPVVTMPRGFTFGSEGLVYVDHSKDEPRPIRVCGPFEVIAQSRSGDGDAWGLLLAWQDPDGRPHRLAVPLAALAGDGAEIRRMLMDRGLSISPSMTARNALNSFLSEVKVTTRMRAVQQVGWHGTAFVLPDKTFGGTNAEQITLQTQAVLDHAYREAGSLEEWQREVGRPAIGNSRLMLALSAAFAAPLIAPCDAESGVIHFRGPSSIGKTTLLSVAGSVWGGGSVGGYTRSWRTTSNGMEGLGLGHSDTLLCLDELAQLNSKDAADAAYTIANGGGKARASRDGSARRSAKWRTLALSTGEISLADKIAEDGRGRRAAAGAQVRILDVPADAGRGMGLFEHLHGFPDAGAFARALTVASRRFYGTASRAFLAELVANLDAASDSVKATVTEFVARCVPPKADSQVERAAQRFGLIASGGALAAVMGIAPWTAEEANRAAAECFAAWISARGGVEAGEIKNGVDQLRAFVSAHGMARCVPAWSDDEDRRRDVPNLAGFRKRNSADGWDYYITVPAWAEICAGLDPARTAAHLADRGYLIRDGLHLKPKISVPGHGRMRLYHVSGSILEGEPDVVES